MNSWWEKGFAGRKRQVLVAPAPEEGASTRERVFARFRNSMAKGALAAAFSVVAGTAAWSHTCGVGYTVNGSDVTAYMISYHSFPENPEGNIVLTNVATNATYQAPAGNVVNVRPAGLVEGVNMFFDPEYDSLDCESIYQSALFPGLPNGTYRVSLIDAPSSTWDPEPAIANGDITLTISGVSAARDVPGTTRRAIARFMGERGRQLMNAPSPGETRGKNVPGWLFGNGPSTSDQGQSMLGGPNDQSRDRAGRRRKRDDVGSAGRSIERSGDGVGSARAAGDEEFGSARAVGAAGSGAGDSGNVQFSTSLSDIRRAASRKTDYPLGMMGLGGLKDARVDEAQYRFDVWARATFSYFTSDRLDGKTKGHVSIIQSGSDYLVRPGLMIGAMSQLDAVSSTLAALDQSADGLGWMIGPYVIARLTETLTFDAHGLWGRSENHVSPFGDYEDSFSTSRHMVSAALTGQWNWSSWYVRPRAEVKYYKETQNAYTSVGSGTPVDIASQTYKLGRLTFGPEIGRLFERDNGTAVGVFGAARGVWEFASTNETTVAGAIVSPDPFYARLEAGIRLRGEGGSELMVSGSYDGVGSDSYKAYTGGVRLRVPLP